MENKNILFGSKDSKDTDSYTDLMKVMKDEFKVMNRTWYLALKHPKLGESYKYKFIYFRREYINQVAECVSKLDFEALAKIPHEKDGCAYRLDCRYLNSGKVLGMQIVEARTGVDGGYFFISPAMILLNEESEKAYKALKNKL